MVGLQISLGHFSVLIDKSEAKVFKRPFPSPKKKKKMTTTPTKRTKQQKRRSTREDLILMFSLSTTEPIPKSLKKLKVRKTIYKH